MFERLFGVSDRTEPRRGSHGCRRTGASWIRSENGAPGCSRVGTRDQAKVAEYLEAVRDVERRIQQAEQQSARDLPAVEHPSGVLTRSRNHSRVMLDLWHSPSRPTSHAWATFLVGREQSTRSYPEVGVAEPHHPVSHHQNRPEQLEKLAKINVFHMRLFTHFLERLKATPDGDGSLLDHSMLLYGAGLSNSDVHLHHDLPIMLVGGGAGRIKGGRHLVYPKGTPVTNLFLNMLDKLGVPAENLGDSTGRLEHPTDL